MIDLKGRAAVVTGGGSGIGESLCRAWAARGMHIVVADIDEAAAEHVAESLRGAGTEAIAVGVDVGDTASVDALAEVAYRRFGEVAILCNNAGVMYYGPVAEAPPSAWDWALGANLYGIINGVRSFVPKMRVHGGCHIINTISVSAMRVVMAEVGVYATSKFAALGLSEALRVDLAAEDIGVSVLCPGLVDTAIQHTARRSDTAARAAGDISRDPSGRTPDQVAAMVIDGVAAGRFYIFTHASCRVPIERRFAEISAAFDLAPID